MMEDPIRRRVLVTGASRGIGRATAELLASRGYEVFGTSRNPSGIPIDDLISGVVYLPFDLEKQESAEDLAARTGPIDVLINNAGMSQIGTVEEITTESVYRIFEQNFFGHLRLIKLYLPHMRQRRSGTIINIGSLAGRTPVPFSSMYAATKAAIEALSKGLRSEVRGFGIHVVIVAPCPIKSTLQQEKTYPDSSPYLALVQKVKDARDRNLREGPSPVEVAERIGRILDSPDPRPYYPAGKSASFIAIRVKCFPERLVERIVRKRFGIG